jgi:hypothetical protein
MVVRETDTMSTPGSIRRAAGAAVAALVLATTAAAGKEAAEPPAEPVARAAMPWPAPVGHRQPRAADLPVSQPKDDLDLRIERINRDLDRRLRICRNC